MPRNILMPSLTAGMEEARLLRWLKRPGDPIAKGDALVEIEMDKAIMEMEAEEDGVLGPLLIADDTPSVPVNAVIGLLLGEDETEADIVLSPVPARPCLSTLMAPDGPAPLAPPHSAPEIIVAKPSSRAATSSPLARRLAQSYGLDIGALKGSGPRGRVVRLDVEHARRASAEAAQAEPPRPPARPSETGRAALHHAWLRQGEGAPLVLLHGFGSDLNGWRPFLAGAPLNRPVLGIDLPGHGGSRGYPVQSFDNIAAAVSATLAHLDLGRVDLVAHSLGGAVATAVTAEGSHDLGSLFLIAPAGLGPEINGGFIDGLARARCPESLAPWLRQLVTDEALISAALVRASLGRPEDEAARQTVARALFPDGTQAFSIRAALARISVPVSVVFGREDRIIPPRHSRVLPGHVALHLFDGVGHMPHLEIRDQLWRLLVRHLRAAS
ncbi:acetoin dehydrogenase dihydrolipoyllysine-residue acetyltransferase subunit [Ancylobacter sp.]|uniref:acetoin dehydrogenase dihydrolipoyllysine-residue acetyltransferase subunit n=1 Tax=Ancylobacter sp. TaxID=1872567 RepID=UPI003C7E403F